MTFVSTGNLNLPIKKILKSFNSVKINKIELSGGIYNKNINKTLSEYNQTTFSIHNYFPVQKEGIVLNLASLDKNISQKSLDFMFNSIKLASSLGLRYYSFHAGFRINPSINQLGKKIENGLIVQDRNKSIKEFIKNVGKLEKFASSKKVQLLIENNVCSKANSILFRENPFLMCDFIETQEIMESLEGKVRLLLDVGHLKVSSKVLGFSKEKFMNYAKSWTQGYHLSENDGESDLNMPVSEDSWFWKHINPKIEYRVIEVYRKEPSFLKNQIELTDRNFLKPIIRKNKSTNIPIQKPYLGKKELKYATDCIKSGWISSQGKYLKLFENEFGKIHNNSNCLAVSNGTSAIHLALIALGIKKGDEVIVPDITFAAVINSVIHAGATPIICSVNKESWCIDFDNFQKYVSKKTRAVIPVHLYGYPVNLSKIWDYCKKNNIFVIEDCAEALGSRYNNFPVGTKYCHASTFSFFGNKTITTGEGGMIIFKNKKYLNKAKILRDHGMSVAKKYYHNVVGFNYRMTSLQAAVGVAQISKLNAFVAYKVNIYNTYKHYLSDCKHVSFQKEESGTFFHSYWLVCIKVSNKKYTKSLIEFLKKNGIDARTSFYPLSSTPIFRKYYRGNLNKISSEIFSKVISLPSSVTLSKSQILKVCNNIKHFFNTIKKAN